MLCLNLVRRKELLESSSGLVLFFSAAIIKKEKCSARKEIHAGHKQTGLRVLGDVGEGTEC